MASTSTGLRWPRKKIAMQTTRLTSIGRRVEIATLMAARTVTSKNPSARPGRTCRTCSSRLAVSAIPPADSRKSYAYLYQTPSAKSVPSRAYIASTPSSIPRNLPTMNWRRLIGFDRSVIAVFPSISSATAELAVRSARIRQANEIVARPVSLYILMSSPNVKYDTKIVTISDEPARDASTKKAGCRIASLAVASATVSDFMGAMTRTRQPGNRMKTPRLRGQDQAIRDARPSESDREVGQRRVVRGLDLRLDGVDLAVHRAPDRIEQLVNIGQLPLGDHLDSAVVEVADPPRDGVPLRQPLGGEPEPDALDPARVVDPTTNPGHGDSARDEAIPGRSQPLRSRSTHHSGHERARTSLASRNPRDET